MAGRDARFSASDMSQSSRRASSASTASSAAASPSVAERARELAAWRERRDQQRQQQQLQPPQSPATTPTKKPATPPKPKPFRASASSGPSDEEKQLILQRRRELMRSPMKLTPLPQRPAKPEPRAAPRAPPPSTPTASSGSSSSTDSRESAATPSPRTPPPRRSANQDVPSRRTRPPPPQTPPLAPRPHRSRLSDSEGSPPVKADSRTEPERAVTPPTMRLSDDQSTSIEQDQPSPERLFLSPTLAPIEAPDELLMPSSPPAASLPVLASSESLPESREGDVPPLVERPQDALLEMPSVFFLPPPIVVSPTRQVEPTSGHDVPSTSPASQPASNSPRKQVRFAIEEVARAEAESDRQHSDKQGDMQSGANSHDPIFELSDTERGNLLTDSQASFEREMNDREQLLSEVDELIHHRTENIFVTDHVLHRHSGADGRETIDESVVSSHTEETLYTHVVEETATDDPSIGAEVVAPLTTADEKAARTTPNELSSDTNLGSEAEMMNHRYAAEERSVSEGDASRKSYSGVTLRVAKPPPQQVAGEDVSSGPVQARTAPVASRVVRFRSALVVILVVMSLVAIDVIFPRFSVSRGLRVAKRAGVGLMGYVGSRIVVWMWHSLIHPASTRVCQVLIASNEWLEPRAKALHSLATTKHEGFPSHIGFFNGVDLKELGHRVYPAWEKIDNFQRDPGHVGFRAVTSVFNRVSSTVADAMLFVFTPFMRPLPSIDPESTVAAHQRLQELTAAQFQLRLQVKDLMRTQEEWALEELERMKLRRVAYTTATKEILDETTKVMLKAIQEAKLSAAEHIEAFTNELARELMTSIQPELEEYERLEAEYSREHAHQEATLEQLKREEAAHLELLSVESVKRQTASKINEEFANDRKAVAMDKIFVEVDVMEIVETVENALTVEADAAKITVADSFKGTVDEAKTIAEAAKADLETITQAVETVIERAEKQFAEDAAEELAEREQELKREHDAAQAEIDRLTDEELERLTRERMAAVELAGATVLAEEAVRNGREEANHALDVQFEAGKLQLEQEVLNAGNVAVKVERLEVERIVVEEEVINEVIESQVVDEVEQLARDVGHIETTISKEVEDAKGKLAELEQEIEGTVEQVAAEEVQRLEREHDAANANLDAVASNAEGEIATSGGIVLPQEILPMEATTKATTSGSLKINAESTPIRSITDETEREHMMMLSIGFLVLALLTAYVLYPRWRRLVVNPTTEAKAMPAWARRRRRRSWQRPAQVSDSEPEEVILLQTGSSSDDGLSDTNEPEPEVVEQMSGVHTPQASSTQSTRMSYTSYSRAVDFSGQGRHVFVEDEEEEDELVTPPPARRALRRRRH